MAAITVRRYRIADDTGLGAITAPLLRCQADYALYGGCQAATLLFQSAWGADFLTNTDEYLTITGQAGVPIFHGRVVMVSPKLEQSAQEVRVEGWWQRIAELPIVDDPASDRLEFGPGAADHPDITTAFGVAQWLFSNLIASDGQSPVSTGTLTAPSVPCKLGGVYTIFAADKLKKVLEDLAAMEDSVVGVDARGRFYFLPRTSILASSETLDFRVAEAVDAETWKGGGRAIGLGGQFTQDRRPPNTLVIATRDIDNGLGNRLFRYEQTFDDGTRRLGIWSAPQIRTGPAARRLALGLFRRFSFITTGPSFVVKADNLDGMIGWRRMEPHRGRARIYSEGDLVNDGLVGSMSVDWSAEPIRVRITFGELRSQPGSGNPITDPFARVSYREDDPQIDQGAAWIIDEDDGYDGDGDDFHSNPEREFPSDPPGEGVDALDYGSNEAADSSPYGSATGMGLLCRVKSIQIGSPTTYTVEVLDDDGTTVLEERAGQQPWPSSISFDVDDEAWLLRLGRIVK